ncbi:hypothetical protein Lesp02_03440 [Lentzea sp. NBRC 105346]|uniref:hypothetical protein n=1 Tax=Lentzea sp. NBRC 105346 TaxID=3032205 RepID=UPI0024A24E1A|nr:hypothetical protein [Lentzea sp. NBRC 105346]GLZ28154.1 hypothetical protein Lesp02_03440 [Lentzea sp. NBRC 105346]
MLTPLITGFFALGGVALGVILEPVRAVFAARARSRQERTERCARLVEAAITARSALIRLNTIHRRRTLRADVVGQSEVFDVENIYYGARNEIRQVVGLLDLFGPEELAKHGRAIREMDRELGKVRFDVEDAVTFERYTLPSTVRQAADAMELEIQSFTEAARRYIR